VDLGEVVCEVVQRYAGFQAGKVLGELIEDRGSQITLSALVQQAPLEEKKKWDADFAKRTKIKAIADRLIPEFSVRMGGRCSWAGTTIRLNGPVWFRSAFGDLRRPSWLSKHSSLVSRVTARKWWIRHDLIRELKTSETEQNQVVQSNG